MKKIYIWYSGATSITGDALTNSLVEKLDSTMFEVSGGVSEPENMDLVICYGTKTSEPTVFESNTHVLNHPDNIRINRNKFLALETMVASEINLPYFSKLSEAVEDENIEYPVILRTNYHQGGRGLSICTSHDQLKELIAVDRVGFGYAQKLLPFKSEYRIHIFKDNVVSCAIKVPQRDATASWKAVYMEKIERIALKKEIDLDTDLVDICLNSIVKDITLPDLVVKSNKRGWCFTGVANNTLSAGLIDIAKKAVKSLGLDFGAVDCAIDYSETPYVIEVNTGPGLQGRTLTTYLDTFSNYIINKFESQETEHIRVSTDPRNFNDDLRDSLLTPEELFIRELRDNVSASENNDNTMSFNIGGRDTNSMREDMIEMRSAINTMSAKMAEMSHIISTSFAT